MTTETKDLDVVEACKKVDAALEQLDNRVRQVLPTIVDKSGIKYSRSQVSRYYTFKFRGKSRTIRISDHHREGMAMNILYSYKDDSSIFIYDRRSKDMDYIYKKIIGV